MVNIASKIIAKIPTWGGVFNHTVILNKNINTMKLDFLVV